MKRFFVKGFIRHFLEIYNNSFLYKMIVWCVLFSVVAIFISIIIKMFIKDERNVFRLKVQSFLENMIVLFACSLGLGFFCFMAFYLTNFFDILTK